VDLSSGSGIGIAIGIGAERQSQPASHEMVCIGSLRALVLRAAAGAGAGRRRGARVLCGRAVDACVTPRARGFRAVAGARAAKMMLDSSDADSAAAPAGQLQLQRRAAAAVAQPQDGAYASGGWQR
jgi:protein phosphatase 1L